MYNLLNIWTYCVSIYYISYIVYYKERAVPRNMNIPWFKKKFGAAKCVKNIELPPLYSFILLFLGFCGMMSDKKTCAKKFEAPK